MPNTAAVNYLLAILEAFILELLLNSEAVELLLPLRDLLVFDS